VSEQYGLKRLIEHIWKVIGVASTCEDIRELKRKMEHGSEAIFRGLSLTQVDANERHARIIPGDP
jgi:hypothetical protein